MTHNTEDECIICLQNEELDQDNTILPIDSINELEKTCLCKYNVHKNCIQEWLVQNPVCVICNKPLYYNRSLVDKYIIQGLQYQTINS